MPIHRPAATTRLLAEPLEPRHLLAVGSAVRDDTTGALVIRCSDTPTVARVQAVAVGTGVARAEFYRVTQGAGTLVGLFRRTSVARIEFHGGTAADVFSAAGVTVPVMALGNDGNDTLTGGSGSNTIDGGNGDDVLVAVGRGTLYGQAGDDRISSGNEADTIDGGEDDDTIFAGGGADIIDGGTGNDTIDCGDGDDVARGYDGNDGILGGPGTDDIDGGRGSDGINGGTGADSIRGGDDGDLINGGDGDDTIDGGAGPDTILGGIGRDTISGGADADTLRGNADADEIRGDAGSDTIFGDAGDDRLRGGADADRIAGGPGRDTIDGDDGDDVIDGGSDADLIRGHNGGDTIDGGGGDDMLLGGAGYDTVRGGPGRDVVNGGVDIDTLFGGDGDDWLVAIDDFAFDALTGDAGRDVFWRDLGQNNSDIVTDLGAIDVDQGVRGFANPGADRTLDGDSIPGPAYAAGLASASFADKPLFSAFGPRGTDINQGVVSDCKVVSALAALSRNNAADNGWAIRRALVDFGDGTYGLRLGANHYRVDSVLPLAPGSQTVPNYASLGADDSIWVSIAEKGIALADQRTPGAPTYADLSSTGADEVFAFFGSAQTGVPFLRSVANAQPPIVGYPSAAALGADIVRRFRTPNQQYLTISLSDSPSGRLGTRFVVGHAYTVWSLNLDAAGALQSLVLRNPWGSDIGNFSVSYGDANPGDGLVTITLAELFSSVGRLNWGTRVN